MDFRAGHLRTRSERRRKGGQKPDWLPWDRRQSDLAVICWKNVDGTESSGHPLPRAHAEALLRAFVGQYPLPSFWLEVPPALDDTLRYR
jgi:hypothetical protein